MLPVLLSDRFLVRFVGVDDLFIIRARASSRSSRLIERFFRSNGWLPLLIPLLIPVLSLSCRLVLDGFALFGIPPIL